MMPYQYEIRGSDTLQGNRIKGIDRSSTTNTVPSTGNRRPRVNRALSPNPKGRKCVAGSTRRRSLYRLWLSDCGA